MSLASFFNGQGVKPANPKKDNQQDITKLNKKKKEKLKVASESRRINRQNAKKK